MTCPCALTERRQHDRRDVQPVVQVLPESAPLDLRLESLTEQGRARYGSRYCFSGANTLNDPFRIARDENGDIATVAYVGSEDAVRLATGKNKATDVTLTAREAFVDSRAIDGLIALRDTLRNTNGLDDGAQADRIRECVGSPYRRVNLAEAV